MDDLQNTAEIGVWNNEKRTGYTSLGLQAAQALPVTRQHNDLVQSCYTMTLLEKQIINLAMSKIFAEGGYHMGDAPTFRLSVKEFQELYQVEHNDLYNDLKKAVKRLGNRQVNVKKRVGNKVQPVGWFNWLESCFYHEKEGALSVRFTVSANDYLYVMGKAGNFTQVELLKIAGFRSFHTVRLYELLAQFRTTGLKIITVEELKEILQLDTKYKTFKDFNKRILRPAIAEINKHHALRMTYAVDKQGRTPHMLTFRFKRF